MKGYAVLFVYFLITVSTHSVPPENCSYYISTDGNDSGSGNHTDPLATINRAIEKIEEDLLKIGFVCILEGDYGNQALAPTNTSLDISLVSMTNASFVDLTSLAFKGNNLTIIGLKITNLVARSDQKFELHFCEIEKIELQDSVSELSQITFNFTNVYSGNLNVSGSLLVVEYCNISGLTQFIISRFSSFISIYETKFVKNNKMVVSSKRLLIEQCLFEQNSGVGVGAIESDSNFADTADLWSIKTTSFIDNTAIGTGDGWYGGVAPAIASIESISIANTFFSCNAGNKTTSIAPVVSLGKTILLNSYSNTSCPVLCSLGEFSRDFILPCTSCDAGYFSNVSNASSCHPCPSGSSTDGNRGSTECNPCDPGTSSPGGTPVCIPCNPGTYAPNSTMAKCISCIPGSYQPLFNQTNCTECPIGTTSTQGSFECSICGEGTFANVSTCVTCPAWLTSKPGSTSCTTPNVWMILLIVGLGLLIFIGIGVFIIRNQKRRRGYLAVQEIVKGSKV
eukprot:TRINITY_DN7752_c0_g1_i1.p1 TRINITY_DN7752_c0_g1~~TRINITY_DN7752_c0_g1_i1.p1  ORF type:complete len:509 (-),score=91.41 TRINITY_DN7752_c0_g1_i1:37-1563(-)